MVTLIKKTATKEGTCVLCKRLIWKGMMKRLDENSYLCKSCWDKLAEKVFRRLIKEELRKEGIFNPSAR